MATLSIQTRLDRLRDQRLHRFIDQELEIRSHAFFASSDPKKSGLCVCGQGPHGQETILRAGGRWDRRLRLYVGPTEAPHILSVKWSQEKAARQLAEWFREYDADELERVAIEMYADRRRGGKTFFVCILVILFLLRYPLKKDGQAQIGWVVVPTFSKQREVHETLRKIVPSSWIGPGGNWRYWKSERLYRLPTGAGLYIKSGDDADLLKEGGVGVIGVNEAQEISGVGIIHCLGNNIDSGGLCGIALNPPNSSIGLWAMNLHDAIDAGQIKYARATEFPPEGNDAIDQGARTRFSEVAAIIDPKQQQRDALGLWIGIHDLCYPFFKKGRHVKPLSVIAGLQDITADLNALTSCLPKGDLREWGVGMDFQGRPWCGAVRLKAYALPESWRLLDGEGNPVIDAPRVLYVVHDECTNDLDLGQWWHEERLCSEMITRGWSPDGCLVIGDGTGHHQGSTGRQRGREADPATFSFPLVQSFGFSIHAPLERIEYIRHPRRGTEIVPHYSNPPVPVRLNLANTVLDQGRLLIASECGYDAARPNRLGGETAESFRICAASLAKKPTGKGAHLTDAVGYMIYRWETAYREATGMGPLAGDVVRQAA